MHTQEHDLKSTNAWPRRKYMLLQPFIYLNKIYFVRIWISKCLQLQNAHIPTKLPENGSKVLINIGSCDGWTE